MGKSVFPAIRSWVGLTGHYSVVRHGVMGRPLDKTSGQKCHYVAGDWFLSL